MIDLGMSAPLVLIVVQPRGVPGTVIIGRADSVGVTLDDFAVTTDPDVAAKRFGPGATYSIHFPDGAQVERGEDL